ncbi:FAS1-like dehydratase domain-containing protein [Endozoicomonas lisbonensis]|uniref:3-methylfumaryl-CoA hydratase n=1 Tax=Endozoicomonas lisbonensis TaxID=3120522 RepID=A0ABV2SI36_9GAMM
MSVLQPCEVDLSALQKWEGRQQLKTEVIHSRPVVAMAATLDKELFSSEQGACLAPLWHWLYFLPETPSAGLAEDGHPVLGGFLPPVPLSRRMWAGGRLEIGSPLRIGESVERLSEIRSVRYKEGRSGPLVFVEVHHHFEGEHGGSMREEHDIVYRQPVKPGTPGTAPAAQQPDLQAQWSVTVTPDPKLLFRYSALTFNTHRIHYDRSYCNNVEGYSGLVVHGPLLATLLLVEAGRAIPDIKVLSFSFRAVSPILDINDFTVNGRRDGHTLSLWIANHRGELAMQAEARIR